MRLLSKIASHFFVVLTLVTFMVSTTGFTFYTHECMHHDSQKGLISTDNCCVEVVVENQEESNSCCLNKPVKKAETKCHSEYLDSNCCETDINYFRLSEWYVGPQFDDVVECFAIIEVDCIGLEPDTENDAQLNQLQSNPPDEGFKIPIYRLYHRVKIDPPLI